MTKLKLFVIALLLLVSISASASASALYFMDVTQPKDIYGKYASFALANVATANFDSVGHTYIVVVSGTRNSDGRPISGATYNVYLPAWTFQKIEVKLPIPDKTIWQGTYTLHAGIYEGGWNNLMAPISFPRTLVIRV